MVSIRDTFTFADNRINIEKIFTIFFSFLYSNVKQESITLSSENCINIINKMLYCLKKFTLILFNLKSNSF